jgi:hypothetical protein
VPGNSFFPPSSFGLSTQCLRLLIQNWVLCLCHTALSSAAKEEECRSRGWVAKKTGPGLGFAISKPAGLCKPQVQIAGFLGICPAPVCIWACVCVCVKKGATLILKQTLIWSEEPGYGLAPCLVPWPPLRLQKGPFPGHLCQPLCSIWCMRLDPSSKDVISLWPTGGPNWFVWKDKSQKNG